MQFSAPSKQLDTPLKMNDVQLIDFRVQKFLGLSIRSNLKCNVHLNELNTKLSSLCYAFRILSKSVLILLVVYTPQMFILARGTA